MISFISTPTFKGGGVEEKWDIQEHALYFSTRVVKDTSNQLNLFYFTLLFLLISKCLRKRSIPTFLPQKVIVPDFFSHSVKELIVWSPERLWARKKHPAARSIDRGTRSYVFVKVHAPKRSRGSCKCDSWKFIGGKLLSNEEKQLHPIRRVKMDTNRWKRSQ